MDKPLSLIESLMSRKANEFLEISQVYFRATVSLETRNSFNQLRYVLCLLLVILSFMYF